MEAIWIAAALVVGLVIWVGVSLRRDFDREEAAREERAAADAAAPTVEAPGQPSAAPAAPAPAPASEESGLMGAMGWLFFLIGAGLIVAAFMFDASVPAAVDTGLFGDTGRINNLGLLNTKLMLAVAGSACMICGSIFIARPKR